jgi:hypothetical protein
MRYVGKLLIASIAEMAKGTKSIQNNPYQGKTAIDAETLEELEGFAGRLGISDIGYTQGNTRYIVNGFRIL